MANTLAQTKRENAKLMIAITRDLLKFEREQVALWEKMERAETDPENLAMVKELRIISEREVEKYEEELRSMLK